VTRRVVIRWAVLLTVMGLSLYLLAPSLLATFSSFPQLGQFSWWWLVAMVLLEGGSLACQAGLQRLTLGRPPWFPVATSQLTGNAAAKVVPGGGAAGAAVQYGMLRESGIPGTTAVTGVTASNAVTFAALLALPLFALPVIVIRGIDVAHDLQTALWLALVALVGLLGGGALLLAKDRPLEAIGNFVERTRNRLRPNKPPRILTAERLLRERDVILRVLGDRWWEALLLVGGRWLLDFGVLASALYALGSHPSTALVLLAFVAAQVLALIPVTPGGLGFVEAGLAATLALAGVSAGDAVVATLAYRLASYWLPMPVGLAAWALHKHRIARDGPVIALEPPPQTPAADGKP